MKRIQTMALATAVLIGSFLAIGSSVSRGADAPTTPKTFVDTSTLKAAADFKLKDLDGKVRSLSEFRGKVVIVDFWATWCGPCRLEIPHLISLYNGYRTKGVEVLGVSMDATGPKIVRDFATKQAINYTVLMGNDDVASAYGGIRGIPTAFVITQDGKIYRRYMGYQEKKVFESDIRALLGLGPGAENSSGKEGR